MNNSYKFKLEFETSELRNIGPKQPIASNWNTDHGVFKWQIYLDKNCSNPEEPLLEYWVHCKPQDEAQAELSACYADLLFKIVPHEKGSNVEGLEYNSSQVFHKDTREAGWPDFHEWHTLFDPHEKIIGPRGSIKFLVEVKVLAEFNILKPFSSAYNFDSSIYKNHVPYAGYFCNYEHADSLVVKYSPANSIQDEMPLHFAFIPEIESLLSSCFREIKSSDLIEKHREQLSRCRPGAKVYQLNDDVHPTAFRAIIRFLYRREIPFEHRIIAEIYKIACDCGLNFIAKACTYVHLTTETALPLLPYVLKVGDSDDKTLVLNFICDSKNCRTVLNDQKRFQNLSPDIVRYIASLDYLKASEDSLVKAIRDWAEEYLQTKHNETNVDLERISQFLDEHEISDHIRITSLKSPEKILPPIDLDWLMFARGSVCRKKLKFGLKKTLHKRNGKKPDFGPD